MTGYSKRIQSQLEYGSVDGLLLGMKGGGNGAAMRAAVLGLYPELHQARAYANLQATVTHDTRASIDSAAAVAVAVHYLVHGDATRWNVGMLTQMDVGGDFECPWPATWRVGPHPSQAVRAAFSSLQERGGLSQVLLEAVGFGGDTDTTAAIAMAMGFVRSESVRPMYEMPGRKDQ
jgi:ADP-ribosylglycohydrolase